MRELSHCAITFNGCLIDYEINNFMTVNVEGRQLYSPTVDIVNISGRDGDIIIGQKYPARDIIVHFLIHETKNAFFLENIKKLTEILQSEGDVKFSFLDEEGFRFGRLIDFENPPYDQNFGMGKFTIHCSDPFLYKNLKKTYGKIERLKFRKYPVKIEEIRITAVEAKKLTITNKNRGFKIILNGDFKNKDEVLITKDKITVNGQNRMYWLDFANSDYQNFKIYSEDEVIISPICNFEISYRERVL